MALERSGTGAGGGEATVVLSGWQDVQCERGRAGDRGRELRERESERESESVRV